MISLDIWWKLLMAYRKSSGSRPRARSLESTRSQLSRDICLRFAAIGGTAATTGAATGLPAATLSPAFGRSVGAGTGAPQLSQNLLVGEIPDPHSAQVSRSGLPKPPQNFAALRF